MLRLCIAGKNDIAVNSCFFLLHNMHFSRDNLLIIPNKSDTGIDTWQKSLKKYAMQENLKISTLQEVENMSDVIFISLEFDKIIHVNKFLSTKLYNIHFSLLPAYKGMFTSVMPLLKGETVSGVTLHRIDDGIDIGEIIAQKRFDIGLHDTSRDLYYKFLKYGEELFKENIENILNDKIKSIPQSAIGSSYYSKNEIDFSDIHIDLNKTSFEIHNQIRAFAFKEYQLPKVKQILIYRSELTQEFIGRNHFEEQKDKVIVSGIDGYKVILWKK